MTWTSPIRRLKPIAIWFWRPESPAPLGCFRILVALFCLIRLAMLHASLADIYGQYGLIQWAITRSDLTPLLPHLGNIALLGARFGLSADQCMYAVIGAYAAVLLLLLLGIAARVVAAAAWGLNLVLMYTGAGLLYGMDYFTHIALFYCVLMPCGEAYSLSHWRGRIPRPSVSAGVTRKMLQIQMGIVYASAGFEKASGRQWWNGEAIWRSLTLPTFHLWDVAWLAWAPWLAMAAGWTVLIAECGYPFMVWSPRTRGLWIALVAGMHLGIGIGMGMWLFALIMIILNCGAFGHEVWSDWSHRPASVAIRNALSTMREIFA